MSSEWENHYLELKKLAKGNETAPDFLRRLMRLFVADFEMSMTKRFDVMFWNKLKGLIDGMHDASDGDRLVDVNVQNLAVGFLSDLCLLVHTHYNLPEMGIPSQFTWTDPGVERKSVKSKTKSKVFAAHFMLRMGDLMRYKDNIPTAREYYETSIKITPIDGCVWNQLGILASSSAKYLDSVYFHTRALHATLEFNSASGNLNAIFKRFANRDTSKPMPINELFMSCLSKIHFLLLIENSDEVLVKLGNEAATSKEMIVSLMSVYENLEGGTELEQRAVAYVNLIWSTAHRRLLETILKSPTPSDHLLHLLAFLHSAPEFTDDAELESQAVGRHVRSTASEGDDVIKDSEGFAHFHCLHTLQYPLKRAKLVEMLIGETRVVEEEDEEVFEDDEDGLPSPTPSDEKIPKIPIRKQHDSDSEEEVLLRGRRRGRVQNDSNETDEEDF